MSVGGHHSSHERRSNRQSIQARGSQLVVRCLFENYNEMSTIQSTYRELECPLHTRAQQRCSIDAESPYRREISQTAIAMPRPAESKEHVHRSVSHSATLVAWRRTPPLETLTQSLHHPSVAARFDAERKQPMNPEWHSSHPHTPTATEWKQ